jgi:hypothetical protein
MNLDKVVHLPLIVSHGRHKINKTTSQCFEKENGKRPEDPAV